MTSCSEIGSCEVCGNSSLTPVLDLGRHPLCDDLVPVGDDRVCAEYPIEILYCANCATAHQRFQVPKHELFPRTYHYRSRFTADVLIGMRELVASCERRLSGLADKTVVDIGCNDGSLLGFFRDRGAKTVGIEPTDAILDARDKGHDLLQSFFDTAFAKEIRTRHGAPDAITFTNVFAHIENLPGIIDALRILIAPKTVLVIENHYLGAVLERNQFDTFYHEHPRTYSLSSFRYIARSLGCSLAAIEFPARYGGNIRVFLGASAPGGEDARTIERIAAEEAGYLGRFEAMRLCMSGWRTSTRQHIGQLVARHGALSAKAFPGRAAILLKLLGADTGTISEVFEKPGSMKIGHCVPGTRIPIKSDIELFARRQQPEVILNLAWHIAGEIERYLRQNGYRGAIINVFEPGEFFPGA